MSAIEVDIEGMYASEWFKERPAAVQAAIRAYPPDKLYRMDSGHLAFIVSYTEHPDGTCDEAVVAVTLHWNQHLAFSRKVFGIKLATLEPAEPMQKKACDFCDQDRCHRCITARRQPGSTFCDECLFVGYPELRGRMREPLTP